jgi:hypothetical protein
VLSKLAGPLKVLPREVRETRQRAGQIVGRSNRSRLHHAQVGARRDTQACKLIGRDAAIGGHDQFVTRVLTCRIHDAKCSPARKRALGCRLVVASSLLYTPGPLVHGGSVRIGPMLERPKCRRVVLSVRGRSTRKATVPCRRIIQSSQHTRFPKDTASGWPQPSKRSSTGGATRRTRRRMPIRTSGRASARTAFFALKVLRTFVLFSLPEDDSDLCTFRYSAPQGDRYRICPEAWDLLSRFCMARGNLQESSGKPTEAQMRNVLRRAEGREQQARAEERKADYREGSDV